MASNAADSSLNDTPRISPEDLVTSPALPSAAMEDKRKEGGIRLLFGMPNIPLRKSQSSHHPSPPRTTNRGSSSSSNAVPWNAPVELYVPCGLGSSAGVGILGTRSPICILYMFVAPRLASRLSCLVSADAASKYGSRSDTPEGR